jgi:hypothetical protein
MAAANCLQGKTFFLSSGLTAGLTLSRLIKQHRGAVAFALSKKVDFFVGRPQDADSADAATIAKAVALGVAVVSDEFVRAWASSGAQPTVTAVTVADTQIQNSPAVVTSSSPEGGPVEALVREAYTCVAGLLSPELDVRVNLERCEIDGAVPAVSVLCDALALLDAIQVEVIRAQTAKDAAATEDELRQLSARFFAAVPHRCTLPGSVIRDVARVEHERELVACLVSLSSALARARECVAARGSRLYKGLRCHVREMQLSAEGLRKVWDELGYAAARSRVTAVFAIKRDGEHMAFTAIANQRMLFQAVKPEELLGLLANGVQKSRSGQLGRAVYFSSADTALAKGTKHVAVFRVALGEIVDTRVEMSQLERPPVGKNSIRGVAGSPPFPTDVFAIYDVAQQRLEYVLELADAPAPAAVIPPVQVVAEALKSRPRAVITPSEQQQRLDTISQKEDHLRGLFVSNRSSAEIADPYVSCINVFRERASFEYQSLSPEEATIPRILQLGNTGTRAPGRGCAVVDKESFATAWEQFTGGQLAGLDWSNVVVAGGAVLAALLPGAQDLFAQSDIDMFVFGLTP